MGELIGGFTFSDFKIYSKATVIKTVKNWQKDKYKNQRNRSENPKTYPNSYGQLIFDKGVEIIQCGEK